MVYHVAELKERLSVAWRCLICPRCQDFTAVAVATRLQPAIVGFDVQTQPRRSTSATTLSCHLYSAVGLMLQPLSGGMHFTLVTVSNAQSIDRPGAPSSVCSRFASFGRTAPASPTDGADSSPRAIRTAVWRQRLLKRMLSAKRPASIAGALYECQAGQKPPDVRHTQERL